jgi:hypothetical protein
MKVYVLIAEHFSQGPVITKVFASEPSARREAAELTNIMLTDMGDRRDWPANAWPSDFEKHVERLQDYHGAANCAVEILEREVEA